LGERAVVLEKGGKTEKRKEKGGLAWGLGEGIGQKKAGRGQWVSK